jgi:acetyl-CoA carboxylase carboxyl transferase subunit alpha
LIVVGWLIKITSPSLPRLYFGSGKAVFMQNSPFYFGFERPVQRLEARIAELGDLARRHALPLEDELAALELRLEHTRRRLYTGLSSAQRLEIGRHPQRPTPLDYACWLWDGFDEVHAEAHDEIHDGAAAVVGGAALSAVGPLFFIACQCGRGPSERLRRNFGVPGAAGYRKIRCLAQEAARQGLPLLLMLDACGAQKRAAEAGPALERCIKELVALPVPILMVLTGQAFAGGALPLELGDWVLVQEYAGCPPCRWPKQALPWDQRRIGSGGAARDLLAQGQADEIVAEPLGGAHRDPVQAAVLLEARLRAGWDLLARWKTESLLERRLGRLAWERPVALTG